jgi:hypothetical protein
MGLCKNATLPAPSCGKTTPVEIRISTGPPWGNGESPSLTLPAREGSLEGSRTVDRYPSPLLFKDVVQRQAGPLHSLFSRKGSPSIDIGVLRTFALILAVNSAWFNHRDFPIEPLAIMEPIGWNPLFPNI